MIARIVDGKIRYEGRLSVEEVIRRRDAFIQAVTLTDTQQITHNQPTETTGQASG